MHLAFQDWEYALIQDQLVTFWTWCTIPFTDYTEWVLTFPSHLKTLLFQQANCDRDWFLAFYHRVHVMIQSIINELKCIDFENCMKVVWLCTLRKWFGNNWLASAFLEMQSATWWYKQSYANTTESKLHCSPSAVQAKVSFVCYWNVIWSLKCKE